MKLLSPFVGLLIVGLWVSSSEADISVNLGNKQYLPAPIQESPIKDDYYSTQENTQQQQQKFEEEKYANSIYQIFEVHNHYEPSTDNGENKNDYTPSQKSSTTEEICIEHINPPADFPLDDPNLDASYLGFATGNDDSNQEIIVKHETKNVQTNSNNIPVPFPSNYRHSFPEKSSKKQNFNAVQQSVITSEQYQTQQQSVNKFKGPDYLPPKSQNQQYSRQPVQNSLNTQPQVYQSRHNSGVKTDEEYLPPIPTKAAVGSITQTPFQRPDYLQPQKRNNNDASFKGPDYLPPPQQGSQQQNFEQHSSFKGPDYLPPHEQGSVQSQRNFIPNSSFKASDYLPPQQQHSPAQSQQNFIPNTPFKGSDYLPPHQQHGFGQSQQNFVHNAPLKGPDYLPPQQQHSTTQSQQNFKHNTPFQGPDYLPPHQQTQPQQPTVRPNTPYNGAEYLPPQQTNFMSPDYLPPHQSNSRQQQNKPFDSSGTFKGTDYLAPQQDVSGKTPQQINLNTAFNGPDYLPPHQQEVTNSNTLFKGPDSLPPQQQQISFQPKNTFKGPDYLPPYQSENKKPFKGPDYLPPQRNQVQQHQQQVQSLPAGYDFQRPPNAEQAIAELHTLPEQSPQYQEVTVKSQIQISGQEQSSDIIYGTPTQAVPPQKNGYLPPGYDYQNPDNAEQAINQLHSLDSSLQQTNPGNELHSLQNPYKATQTQSYNQQQSHSQVSQVSQNYQAQAYDCNQQQSFSQQMSQAALQPFKGPDNLPPKTGSQTFKGPDYLPPTSGSQNLKGPDYLPPASGTQTFMGPEYLPPVASGKTGFSQNNQHTSQVFKGHDYLPPVNIQQSYQPPPPPTEATTTQGFISSYTTNVKPNERYVNTRKPFPKYGLPPAKTATVSASNDLLPMHRESASQPQYYAPTMSYTNNAFNSQTYTTFRQNQYQGTPALSQQARQSFQTFIPQNIRQKTEPVQYNSPTAITVAPTTAQSTKSTRAKIRTVQIVNPNNIKTLKVLDSLDHEGVRTIKILGPSYEEPMGDHRIIKVISAGHEQNVQTVKIFNDHQDVTHNTNVAQSQSTGYLLLRHKRSFNSKPKAKGHRHI